MDTIIIKEGESVVQTIKLEKDRFLIGSDQECDIFLDNLLVSASHAELVKTDNGWFFNDLGSDDGSFLDGVKIEEHYLENADEIQIGNFVLIYDCGFLAEDETETKIVFDSENQDPASSVNVPKIIGRQNDGKSVEYLIHKSTVVIGRALGADIVIEDITISRMHAKILFQNGKYYVKDLDSRNGLYVNKKQVSVSEIKNGDIITFGTYAVKFVI